MLQVLLLLLVGHLHTATAPCMQVTLKAPAPVSAISMRFNRADGHSKGSFLPCLSTATWVRSNSSNTASSVSALAANTSTSLLRTLANRQDHPNYTPTATRATWAAPAYPPATAASVYTLVLPKACATQGLKAGIAELQMFTPVTLSLFGSKTGLFDDHFHRE